LFSLMVLLVHGSSQSGRAQRSRRMRSPTPEGVLLPPSGLVAPWGPEALDPGPFQAFRKVWGTFALDEACCEKKAGTFVLSPLPLRSKPSRSCGRRSGGPRVRLPAARPC
jgi:hypothetical protein